MISVIIPTYRPQSYLWECLQSIAAQTLSPNNFEVIIILNGCHEPYYSQIQSFIKENMACHNVRLLQTELGGVSNARNIGLDEAKGNYVTFIDDDDFVSNVYLEELYAAASLDVISLCYPYAFDDGQPNIQKHYAKTILFEKNINKGLLNYRTCRQYFSGPCMKLIPMHFIGNRRFNLNFKNGEDSLFMFLISDKFKNVNLTSQNAIYYRRFRKNSAQLSKKSFKYVITNQIKMILAYCNIYFRDMRHYNFFFFATRILATFKTTIYSVIK